ncbi:MAG: helix-turn-helix transcriptional regulator [Pseudomonadota bacterium]
MTNTQHPLRDWRRQNGITLQALAEKVGVTQSHLSEIENGNNDPSFGLAIKLSRETGISLASFANGAEAS